jgi:DNA-directed RNA polymerase specialized sigma subunit
MPKISKQDLIKLQKTLKTDQAIGDRFNITRQAVHQIRQRYGIPSIIRDTAERNDKIITMYKKGMTGPEIAEKVGLSMSHVYKIVGYAGVKKNDAAVSRANTKKVRQHRSH